MADLEFVKTVRGLEQSGPGSEGENLKALWRQLTASSASRFHAVEETILRWLLKRMNESSPESETFRRYPLTWTLLDCVFARIPLFSLAKSLADRKFIGIVRKTLAEAAGSLKTDDRAATKKKRRRPGTDSQIFDLDHLKSQESSLRTGHGVLQALRTLLNRTGESSLGSHDNVGAEHIKSLFSTATADSILLVAPSLEICNALLRSELSDDEYEGCEDWIGTLSTIWGLHPRTDLDAVQVANNLFGIAAVLINHLKYNAEESDDIAPRLRARWTSDLETFLHQNLALPAKNAFLKQSDLSIVEQALKISVSTEDPMTHVLFAVMGGNSTSTTTVSFREAHTRWMHKVFQVIEPSLRDMDDRESHMRTLLRLAKSRSLPIRVDDLRDVCDRYAFGPGSTDWALLAIIAQCNPGIFQTSGSGAELLQDVGRRLRQSQVSADDESEDKDGAIATIIEAIVQAFRIARDIPGFLRLWYTEMCKVEEDQNSATSAWFKLGRGLAGSDDLQASIEQDLSATQLQEAVDWVKTQKVLPEASCVFCTVIADAVTSESQIDALNRRLFDLVSSVKSSKIPVTALKWRVVSKTLSWAPYELRNEIWTTSKKGLSKALTKSPMESKDAYEAFKCCCQAWLSMSPDSDLISEPASLIRDFQSRFARGQDLPDLSDLPYAEITSEGSTTVTNQTDSARSQYLAWAIRGSSRFARLASAEKGEPFGLIKDIVAGACGHPAVSELLFRNITLDENCINSSRQSQELVKELVLILESAIDPLVWSNGLGRLCIQSLDSLPLDVFRRSEREVLMSMLSHHLGSLLGSRLEDARLTMSLVTRLMRRPTYWETMSFRDLDKAVKALSSLHLATKETSVVLEQMEKFAEMASTILDCMTQDSSERSMQYISGATSWTEDFRKESAGGKEISPFHAVLVKTIYNATGVTRTQRTDLAELHEIAGGVLFSYVRDYLGDLVDKTHMVKLSPILNAGLFIAVEAARLLPTLTKPIDREPTAIRQAAQVCLHGLNSGDVGAWKFYIFLIDFVPSALEEPMPVSLPSLDKLPRRLQTPLLKELVAGVTRSMAYEDKLAYLKGLIKELTGGSQTNGQVLAITCVVRDLLEHPETSEHTGYDLSAAYGQLTQALAVADTPENFSRLGRTLCLILEKRPQSIGQWHIEHTLSTVCTLASSEKEPVASYTWMCKLVEAIIKKHRLRLDGRYHLLIATISALLRDLIRRQHPNEPATSKEALATGFTRLITLICEPTAGAVARSHQSSLDSAMDLAKRAAGRHMYLVLVQYVQLQLDNDVSKGSVTDVLEPAMHSIFNVLPQESRRLANDAMDVNGRAILREMYKRYNEVGKWSGI